MRWGKYILLIFAFTFLFPHVLVAEELTGEQFRLQGLRSFKIGIKVLNPNLIDKDDLKKEAYIYLKSKIPKVLLVDSNQDAIIQFMVDVESKKNLAYGNMSLFIMENTLQYRHLPDVLSSEGQEKWRYVFNGPVWYQNYVLVQTSEEVTVIRETIKKITIKLLRDFVYDYYKANPGE